ncbi:uncharacterized protein LOC143597024 [Bidens hawaiensis]|uniref:uncharacterized protein LOC143597024 n=1 Tax=Bidens hawaiensis TaxID=980011 RepID=UPI00404B99BF
MEKLVLALVYASRRFRIYFHGHPVSVLMNYRIQNVLWKPELSGRLAKWAIELREHTLQYKPRSTFKGKVLADFITEVPYGKVEECRAEEKPTLIVEESEAWLLFTNGASNGEGLGAGLKLAGLRMAGKFGAQHGEAHLDSMLIASQVNGSYEAKDEFMASYLEQAIQLIQKFKSCRVKHIKRSESK